MDAKDIQSHLHSLKKLYGLLKKDGDSTPNPATDLLNEHARILLKKLLDSETKRVLKEHSKIIAGTISATLLQQSGESCNKHQSKLSISEKEIEFDKDRKPGILGIAFPKENIYFPQWIEQPVSGALASEPGQRQRWCRLCKKNTINQMDAHFHVDAQNFKRYTDMHHHHHHQNSGPDRGLPNSHRETSKTNEPKIKMGSLNGNKFTDFTAKVSNSDIDNAAEPEEVDCLSKEASESIEQIEMCISALRMRPDHDPQTQYGGVSTVDKSQTEKSFRNRRKTPYELLPSRCMMGPVGYSSRPVPSLRTANEFMSRGPASESDWLMSRYDPTWPGTFLASSKNEARFHRHMAVEDECTTGRFFRTYEPSGSFMYPNNSEKIHSVDSSLKVSSNSRGRSRTYPPKTVLNKKPSQFLDIYGNQSEIRKNKHHIPASDSYSDSSTLQINSRGSDSEEYSSTDQTGEYVTSSAWSESGASPPSYGTNNSYTAGDIEDDVYSSTSSAGDRELSSSGSSKSKEHSSYDQPIRTHARSTYSSESKNSGPSRARKANGKDGKKQAGMWTRMKDKMAIIFHHHHHHHHHHDVRGKNKTKTRRSSSLLEHKGKVVNFSRRNEEACEKQAVEKSKAIVGEKNRKSHFHGLMEGLLRHVRRSKQSKPGKRTFGKLGKGPHGRPKSLNKSHWWKLLQHHRRRKLPNKTRVKIGLGKKARLKALPSISWDHDSSSN